MPRTRNERSARERLAPVPDEILDQFAPDRPMTRRGDRRRGPAVEEGADGAGARAPS